MNHSDTRGFALLTVIFALLLFSVLATAGLFSGRQEMRAALASENAQEAFYLAENGLTQVLAGWNAPAMDTLDTWDTRTFDGTVPGEGRWEVDVVRVADRIYHLQARAALYRGGVLRAELARSVGVTAAKPSLELSPPAALTTLGPTEVRGAAEVDGMNEVPPGWDSVCDPAAGTDMPGVATSPGNTDNITTQAGGTIIGDPEVEGDPSLDDPNYFDQFGEVTWEDLTDMAQIVLGPGTINGTAPDSTASGNCIRSNELNWGNPLNPGGACGDYFPIIHATGSYLRIQSGGQGQGILLVDGDLDLRGDFVFHGIVIVKGNFETQGSGNRVRGAVMAGNTYFEDQTIVGDSVVGYSHCAVDMAIRMNDHVQRPRPFTQRAWSDITRSES